MEAKYPSSEVVKDQKNISPKQGKVFRYDLRKSSFDLNNQNLHDSSQIIFVRSEEQFENILAETYEIVENILSKAPMAINAQEGNKQVVDALNNTIGIISILKFEVNMILKCYSELKVKKQLEDETLKYKRINFSSTCLAFEVFLKIVTLIFKSIENLIMEFDQPSLVSIIIQNSRINMGVLLIEGCVNSDPNDLFYKNASNPDWEILTKVVQFDITVCENFNQRYKEFEKTLLLGQATLIEGLKEENKVIGALKMGLNLAYYSIFQKEGKQFAEESLSKMNSKEAIQAFNLFESNLLKPVRFFSMPNITVNYKIFVPKLLPELTIERLINSCDRSEGKQVIPMLPQDLQELFSNSIFHTEEKNFNSNKEVQIRILSSIHIPAIDPGFSAKIKEFFHIPIIPKELNKILIHYHGGGFICMSSRSHQTYTRKWAIQTEMIVFSVDYRLAPEYPFPQGLDDAFQAYYWIITYVKKYFNIDPKYVFLAGDSAGGNMVAAVTLRAIQTGFRIPDGILMGYPALNLSLKSFTPSLLTALDDFILRYSLLYICIGSYIKVGDPETNPYISPAKISDADLKKFPIVRIMIAGRDPLRDESFKFALRLAKFGKDIKLKEYRLFPHGFWSLDMLFGLKDCKFTITHSIEFLKDMLVSVQMKQGIMG